MGPRAIWGVPATSTCATTSPSSLLVTLCTVLDRSGNDAISPVHSGLPTGQTFPSPRSTRCLPHRSTRTEEKSALIEHRSVMPSTSCAVPVEELGHDRGRGFRGALPLAHFGH